MKRLALLLFLALPLVAQSGPDTVTFSASHIAVGGGSTPVPNGSSLCTLTVDSTGKPTGYRIGTSGGQTTASPAPGDCHITSGGAINPFQLINSNSSSPINACVRVTILDPSGRTLRVDPCVQTGTPDAFASGFCSGTNPVNCSYDAYPTTTQPQPLLQPGLQGAKGDPGCQAGTPGCVAVLLTNPNGDQTINQPPGTHTILPGAALTGNVLTTDPGTVVHAWGNSQTQGFGLPGCNTLTCHPGTEWPAVFAARMGWTLDNQAYGSSGCADLTYQGTTESLWDQSITPTSRNIYAHLRNDQNGYGPVAYRVDYARGCIESQLLWLATPETQKYRAINGYHSRAGAWAAAYNSAAANATTAGASITFFVPGRTVYLVTARQLNSATTYTVSVDGSPVFDPVSQSYTFSQNADIGGAGHPTSTTTIPYAIRIPGLPTIAPLHSVTYTCINCSPSDPGTVFFAAASADSGNGPVVYSLGPVNNGAPQQVQQMDPAITLQYHDVWKAILSDLSSDGKNIVGIDVLDPTVFDPNTQDQPDNIHPAVAGAAAIAAEAVARATSAAQSRERNEQRMPNVEAVYGGLAVGGPPSYTLNVLPGTQGTRTSIPPGFLSSKTGPQTARYYFADDVWIDRVADTVVPQNVYGPGTLLFVTGGTTNQHNFGTAGRFISQITSTDCEARFAALNAALVTEFLGCGSNGLGQPNWANNSVLHSSSNLALSADAGTIFFQVGTPRITVGTVTQTGYSFNGSAGWSGTCATGHSLVVVGGIVTGCQ